MRSRHVNAVGAGHDPAAGDTCASGRAQAVVRQAGKRREVVVGYCGRYYRVRATKYVLLPKRYPIVIRVMYGMV